jgi:ubiquinone/menaquinone biosynthesis C-methylase UbiE
MWDEAYTSGMYLREWDYAEPSQELVAFLATVGLPPGSVALDVGCGSGREALFMAECGLTVTGIDFSPAAIEIAQKRTQTTGVKVDWRVASALNLPMGSGAVDFVNDRGCFHVIPRSERARFADSVARVLKPGGRMLLRGSDHDSASEEGFVAISALEVDRWFSAPRFSRGPVLPLVMLADTGTLRGNLVVLQRR